MSLGSIDNQRTILSDMLPQTPGEALLAKAGGDKAFNLVRRDTASQIGGETGTGRTAHPGADRPQISADSIADTRIAHAGQFTTTGLNLPGGKDTSDVYVGVGQGLGGVGSAAVNAVLNKILTPAGRKRLERLNPDLFKALETLARNAGDGVGVEVYKGINLKAFEQLRNGVEPGEQQEWPMTAGGLFVAKIKLEGLLKVAETLEDGLGSIKASQNPLLKAVISLNPEMGGIIQRLLELKETNPNVYRQIVSGMNYHISFNYGALTGEEDKKGKPIDLDLRVGPRITMSWPTDGKNPDAPEGGFFFIALRKGLDPIENAADPDKKFTTSRLVFGPEVTLNSFDPRRNPNDLDDHGKPRRLDASRKGVAAFIGDLWIGATGIFDVSPASGKFTAKIADGRVVGVEDEKTSKLIHTVIGVLTGFPDPDKTPGLPPRAKTDLSLAEYGKELSDDPNLRDTIETVKVVAPIIRDSVNITSEFVTADAEALFGRFERQQLGYVLALEDGPAIPSLNGAPTFSTPQIDRAVSELEGRLLYPRGTWGTVLQNTYELMATVRDNHDAAARINGSTTAEDYYGNDGPTRTQALAAKVIERQPHLAQMDQITNALRDQGLLKENEFIDTSDQVRQLLEIARNIFPPKRYVGMLTEMANANLHFGHPDLRQANNLLRTGGTDDGRVRLGPLDLPDLTGNEESYVKGTNYPGGVQGIITGIEPRSEAQFKELMRKANVLPQSSLNGGSKDIAAVSDIKSLMAGASPWQVAFDALDRTGGKTVLQARENAVLEVAKPIYELGAEYLVDGHTQPITKNDEAGKRIDAILDRITLLHGEGSKEYKDALERLSNPYNLSFGSARLRAENDLLNAAGPLLYPDDYKEVRQIYEGRNRDPKSLGPAEAPDQIPARRPL